MRPSGASLSNWLGWLETLSPDEIELGLDRLETMLARLEAPRPAHVFLVAGTNGKGSSVTICAALMRAGEIRVGAYTSPHLHDFNERIVVDGQPAEDADIIAAFERIESCRDALPLTYFEFTTLAAILLFAAAELDVWILEIGLGGRLDACNAIEPSASLITNISLDHRAWLGDTLEEIAAEKAGVMRAGVVTVFADEKMPAAIEQHATETGACLLQNGRDFDFSIEADGTWSWRHGTRALSGLCRPGLQGDIQIANAAGVLTLLAAAGFEPCLHAPLINRVMPTLRLSGRLQRLRQWRRNWIVDVAHNAASAQVLANELADERGANDDGATLAIIGVMQNKDLEQLVRPLLARVDQWIAVSATSPRALAAGELARRVANDSGKACYVAESIEGAVDFARRTSAENDRIVVTGSFLTVGPALRVLGQASASESGR